MDSRANFARSASAIRELPLFLSPARFQTPPSARARKFHHSLRLPHHPGRPRDLESAATLEIHEQQPCDRIGGDIAQGLKHSIASVIGPDLTVRCEDANEARIAAAMRSVSAAFTMMAGNEKCIGLSDPLSLLTREPLSLPGITRRPANDLRLPLPGLEVLGTIRVHLPGRTIRPAPPPQSASLSPNTSH